MSTSPKSNQTPPADDYDFAFREFFPYLVRTYYRAVSAAVSDIYSKSYGLSVSEWRTMAVLGPQQSLSASEIVAQSSMDKVNVSRAVKGLQARGFLTKDADGSDKRRIVLRLTNTGKAAFGELIPRVKQVEKDCLKDLSSSERDVLISWMSRVQKNAENLSQQITNKSGR